MILASAEESHSVKRSRYTQESRLGIGVTGRVRNPCWRGVPEDGDRRADLLPVEEKVRRNGVAELRRPKHLEDENRKLKSLVADLALDAEMLQDVLRKKL